MRPPRYSNGGPDQPCGADRLVAIAAMASRATKPTAKFTAPAKNGSPVTRARWPLAACCSAVATPATTVKARTPMCRLARAPSAEATTAAIVSATPATRPAVTGWRPAGLSPMPSAARLPAVWPQTSATLSSATPTSGAPHAPAITYIAPPSPPSRYHGRTPGHARSARGIAPSAVAMAPSAIRPTALLTAAASSAEPIDWASRPLT